MCPNKSFYIISFFLFLISNQNFANISYPKLPLKHSLFAIDATPIITATGNQLYCPGTSMKIVTDVTITDPDNVINEIYIQISAGYVKGQDLLTLNNALLHPTITIEPFNENTGKLRLYDNGTSATAADFEAAIKDIEFSNSSTSPNGIRNFSISIGQANYLPRNGHYYQFIPITGITWAEAKSAAEENNYYDLRGYLATLTAADEAKISGEQAAGAGWIGGSDAETEGVWKWVTGPAIDRVVFWNGAVNGSSPNFSLWNDNEPNQAGNENYAHITAPGVGPSGSWNDLSNTGDPNPSSPYYPQGYIVEYGGMPGDPILQISASTTIVIPRIESTTPDSICGSGPVTLKATASNAGVNWYSSNSGGDPIATGNSFTTPAISTTTSYYVDVTSGSCPTVLRREVIATINPIPTITSTTPNSRCDSGSVALAAAASGGTINWYNVPTGGAPLASGTTFMTPILATTTTYYVDAIENGCTSPTRTAVIATVSNSPAITSTSSAARCDAGTLTLGAVASTGSINWYNVATGGTSIGTGTAFTTPSIGSTTTYYAEASTAACKSITRTAVTATVTITPTISSTTPNSRCDSGTLNLEATATAGTINWYDVSTGGVLLATGTTFTTPSISTTKTYYVTVIVNGCKSPTRTAITATVNNSPTVSSTSPSSVCGSGTVTLAATASAGNINWYDASTGGSLLFTGNSFTTPSINSTRTYYAEAVLNECKSPRIRVTAAVYPITTVTEELILCQGESTILDASISGMKYLWSPGGETTQTIVITAIGNYSVTISSPTVVSCESKKEISVTELPKPVISSVLVNENSIKIELVNNENYYEYSINGLDFQVSNQFSYIPSGQYSAFVRDDNGCNLVAQDFTVFTIPKYFTPNNDGFNDVWQIKEMGDYLNSRGQIFDRYGKLIITLNYFNYTWDGKYENKNLPADDYWYRLRLDNTTPEMTGHFTLKR
jgi:gliding motility-associated-like protein